MSNKDKKSLTINSIVNGGVGVCIRYYINADHLFQPVSQGS